MGALKQYWMDKFNDYWDGEYKSPLTKEKKMERKPLTWGELAMIFNKHTNKRAYTLPMDVVYDWAISRPDLFDTDKEGQLFLKEE